MDLNKLLSSVNNITDYILATENIQKCENVKIQLTMSMILKLKKIRSLEIEFFNKCEGNGVTFIVFERMLKQPPSKTWHLLGKEMISMVQYWLEAVRKHLIIHNPRWLSFLASLLRFIQDIRLKDRTLTNVIVEQTTECLLDIACNTEMDEIQRDKVLRCVNLCSAGSSRELRTQMMEQLNQYFVKLAAILSDCGHLPTQMGIMELLVRWLVRRHDPSVRAAAAGAWFPSQMFSKETVDIFLKATWMEFYLDSREFLHSHNKGRPSESVLCCALSVGLVDLFNGASPNDCIWLDINCGTRSITSYLELRDTKGVDDGNRLDMLVITDDNTFSIQLSSLCRATREMSLVVKTLEPPQLTYTYMEWEGDKCYLRARIFGDLSAVDGVLRSVFHDKYLGYIDLEALPYREPMSVSGDPGLNVTRRYRSGYAVRSRNPLPWSSPSTDSTTSLAQLRDKLTALPPLHYSKVTQKIAAAPDLPVVKEVNEDFSNRSSKPRRCGVSVKYKSDSEAKTQPKKKPRCFSPVVKENSASLLLVATLGTTDESIINDTFDKIYNANTEVDLLDLLVEEALENGQKDSGIISGKRTQESDVVENTPMEKDIRHKKFTPKLRAKSTLVSNSKINESDTEVNDDTPCYVYDRRKAVPTTRTKESHNVVNKEIMTFDAEQVDAFFSQHLAENKAESVVISPTLAKKINETSSEPSDDLVENIVFKDGLDNFDLVFEEDIVDWLGSIIDKVCSDLDNCTDLNGGQQHQPDILGISQRCDNKSNVSDISKTTDSIFLNNDTTKAPQDSKNIILKFKQSKTQARGRKMNTKQKKGKCAKVPSDFEEDKISIENTNTNSPVNTTKALLTRKKRKLYSPKDHDNDNEILRTKTEKRQSNNCETPIAACYKDLENARKTQTKLSRKSSASTEPLTSPKTKKLNILFDKIKETVDNDEKITIVKKLRNKNKFSVYNLSSESDDEAFKKKRVQKRISSSSLESSANKRGRMVKPVNNCDFSEGEGKRNKKSKMVKPSKPRKRNIKIEPNINLIDERMRVTKTEVLETSFVKQTADKHADEHEGLEPEPILQQAPFMESIPDSENDVIPNTIKSEKIETHNKCNIVKIKKEKGISKNTQKVTKPLVTKKGSRAVSKERDSATVSPLPGLVVETEQQRKDDFTSSIEANLLQRFKNIYTEGKDLNDTDGTQNMLLGVDNCNDDSAVGLATTVNVETVETLDMDLEKSIATGASGGKSPITGHNDLNESPPNVKSLEENIQHRDLDIQELSPSLAEFLVNMRNQLNCSKTATVPENKTSPVIPSTRMSSKERALSAKSSDSIPKLVLNRLSSEEIGSGLHQTLTPKSHVSPECRKTIPKVVLTRSPSVKKETSLNPVVTPKSSTSSSRVVLTRMSTEEIEKYLSPTKTPENSSTRSLTVVLDRISSDEINRWLPMPKSKEVPQEKPKIYNTRRAPSKPNRHTINKVVKQKIKSVISPVKLNFDIPDNAETRGNTVLRPYKTRSSARSIKSIKSCTTNVDNEAIIIDSQKSSDDKITEKCSNENDIQIISQETVLKSSAERNDGLIKDKIPVSSVAVSDVNAKSPKSKSVESVNEWFNRNATSPVRADNVVIKDVLHKVLEMLETTLAEIHQKTGKNLMQYFLTCQKDLNNFKEDMLRRLQEIEDKQKKLACEVMRIDTEEKQQMVNMLREDIEAVLDLFDKQDKC